MNGNIELRYDKLNEDNIIDAFAIYSDFKGHLANYDQFRKKHLLIKEIINDVGFTAYHNKQPVGFTGFIPFTAIDEGKKLIALFQCDSIVHNRYRGLNIFNKLCNLNYEIIRLHDVKFCISNFNEDSINATKKLGWQFNTRMVRYHVKVKTLPVNRVAWKYQIGLSVLLNRFEKIAAPYFYNEYNLVNPLIEEGFISFEYSADYFFKKKSERKYLLKIENCIFLLKIKSIMEVGTVWFNDNDELINAVEILKSICAFAFVNEIIFQVASDSKLQKALSSFLAEQPSWLIGNLLFDNNIDASRIRIHGADIDTF